MQTNLIWVILGMGLVTYIPRMLPFLLLKNMELPAFWQNVLKNVPYATLGALILPGVLFIQESIWYGVVGAATAFVLAFIEMNVIVVVLGSIGMLALVSIIF
ncbi:MAG: AzlD domain-containing protein [Bacillus sp. (in: Bacteria)]|jgi:branched-subunit amino acid transport protein|nr:AzlD domain-containing protein [Bacillus sp. (in: firmicutes)]